MARFKTFDSTGIAPNGRLFAGDLNAIQDMKADLLGLTQTIEVGILKIGESGLQLSRFGAGEAQITGTLRLSGVMRALGGLYGGEFTTTQRDAIAAGSRPKGLIIFNTTTARLEINTGTDAVPVWRGAGYGLKDEDIAAAAGIQKSKLAALAIVDADVAAGAAIAKSKLASLQIGTADLVANAIGGKGTLAARPAASSVPAGWQYWATDIDAVYRSDGTSLWERISMRAGIPAPWISITAPTGWILGDGAAVLAANALHAELRAALIAAGNPFGVSGSDPLLPNTKGRTIVGRDAAQVEFDTLGELVGAKAHALSTAEMPAHAHGVTDPGHAHSIPEALYYTGGANFFAAGPGADILGDTRNTYGNFTGVSIQNAGGGGTHNNIQPSIIMPWILKL